MCNITFYLTYVQNSEQISCVMLFQHEAITLYMKIFKALIINNFSYMTDSYVSIIVQLVHIVQQLTSLNLSVECTHKGTFDYQKIKYIINLFPVMIAFRNVLILSRISSETFSNTVCG